MNIKVSEWKILTDVQKKSLIELAIFKNSLKIQGYITRKDVEKIENPV